MISPALEWAEPFIIGSAYHWVVALSVNWMTKRPPCAGEALRSEEDLCELAYKVDNGKDVTVTEWN